MKKAVGILAVVVAGCLFGASDVRAGAALAPAGKTTGPGLTAAIVIDVTGGSFNPGKGLTSITIQKASTTSAGMFNSSYVAAFTGQCIQSGYDLAGSTSARFTGLISSFIDTPSVLNSLISQFGDPTKAAITSTTYAQCTTVDYGGGVFRQFLSFQAVIQFQP